jgi:hypothetical protein
LASKAAVARFAAAKVKFMQDMKVSAEKQRAEADNAEQIARSATAVQKRELTSASPSISASSLAISRG